MALCVKSPSFNAKNSIGFCAYKKPPSGGFLYREFPGLRSGSQFIYKPCQLGFLVCSLILMDNILFRQAVKH